MNSDIPNTGVPRPANPLRAEAERRAIGRHALEAGSSIYKDSPASCWGWLGDASLPAQECLRALSRYLDATGGYDVDPALIAARRLARHFRPAEASVREVRQIVLHLAWISLLYLDPDDPRISQAAGLVASVSWRGIDLHPVVMLIEVLHGLLDKATTQLGRQTIQFRIENTIGGMMQFEGEYAAALTHHRLALENAYDEKTRLIGNLNVAEDSLALGMSSDVNMYMAAAEEIECAGLIDRLNAIDLARAIVCSDPPISGLEARFSRIFRKCLENAIPNAEDTAQSASLRAALDRLPEEDLREQG